MTIVTSNYRPKRAPKKKRPRTYPENMPAIVTPAPMKKRRGPVIRLQKQRQANDNGQEQPRRSAIVEPKRRPKNTSMLAHLLDDHDGSAAERGRRGELADELFREIVRRAARNRGSDA